MKVVIDVSKKALEYPRFLTWDEWIQVIERYRPLDGQPVLYDKVEACGASSVLVSGMKMPIDCPVCPLAHWNMQNDFTGCNVVAGKTYAINDPAYAESDKRPEWCPLMEVNNEDNN